MEIYGRQRFTLGKLDYSVVTPVSEGLSGEVIAGIAASGAVLVIVAIIIVLLVVRRSRYHKQQYKSMVKHVYQLESNSRAEIKAGMSLWAYLKYRVSFHDPSVWSKEVVTSPIWYSCLACWVRRSLSDHNTWKIHAYVLIYLQIRLSWFRFSGADLSKQHQSVLK